MSQAQVTTSYNALLANVPANQSDYAQLQESIHIGGDVLRVSLQEMRVANADARQYPQTDNQQTLDGTNPTDWNPQ
jgi:hypothetical protein